MKKSTIALILSLALLLVCLLLFAAPTTRVTFAATSATTAADVTPTETMIELQPVVTTGLLRPLYVTNARDGSNRLFIVEQGGRIQVLAPGAAAPTVFLNIGTRVRSTGNEQGLLGLAFHPNFAANRRFFVNYTRQADGATVIAEYTASSADPNVAETTERILLVVAQPFANHNGGMIEFGRDGFLYIGLGDGGSANDPGNRAQNLNELLGKMLRIDVDRADGQTPYSSPADNPFAGATAGRDEIYAYGLRNPWRWSFDRLTGELYLADVGQNAIEEIDIITRGGNYGWRVLEGTRCTGNGPASCATPGFIPPIAEYGRAGGRCSITGGYVYRGTLATLPFGAYVYGDFCSGEILLLTGGAQMLLLDTNLQISSFGEDEAGELYVVSLSGSVHRLRSPTTMPPPNPTPFRINNALVRHRATGEILQPLAVRPNGKKFDLVIFEDAAAPVPASLGAQVSINGKVLAADYTVSDTGAPVFVRRLKKFMLAEAGALTVQVIRADGTRSNQLTLQIVSEP